MLPAGASQRHADARVPGVFAAEPWRFRTRRCSSGKPVSVSASRVTLIIPRAGPTESHRQGVGKHKCNVKKIQERKVLTT